MKIFILLIAGLLCASCNKYLLTDWGKDKFSTVTSERSYLIAVPANKQFALDAMGIDELLDEKLNINGREFENLRYATVVYITPKKSESLLFELEEIDSIELTLSRGVQKFRSLSLSDRYIPSTGTFKYYIMAGPKAGSCNISVKINGRVVLQEEKIYFFQHLPIEANILFRNNDGGIIPSKRFCPESSQCSDTLSIKVSEMLDETGENKYFDDAKARIEYSCKYWKQSASNKRSFSEIWNDCCGTSRVASKTLNPISGDASFNLNDFDKVLQIYFDKNIIGTRDGSVFGIPYFDFLKNEAEEDLKIALEQSNPDTYVKIDENDYMFAYNREKFYEESYQNCSASPCIYNEDLNSPIWSGSISISPLTSGDTFTPSGSPPSGSPVEQSDTASYRPFPFKLNDSHNFYFVPVSIETSDARALGAYLEGFINFQFQSPILSGLNFSGLHQNGPEYRYQIQNVVSATEAGRTEFKISIDGKESVYNKRIIVFPDKPSNINFTDFVFDSGGSYSPESNYSYYMEENNTDLWFTFQEGELVASRNGVFMFLIQPQDNYGNLWEKWDSSDGPEMRLYHNYMKISALERDRCDYGYDGSEDPDNSDDSNPNIPQCSVKINSYHKDGTFVVECYDFLTPAEYNFHPNNASNPSDNISFKYGASSLSSGNSNSYLKVIVKPDDQEVGGANGGIASYFWDPVHASNKGSVYLWHDKTLRICPRNGDDYYLRDDSANHYDFDVISGGYFSSNYVSHGSGFRANRIVLGSPDYLTLEDEYSDTEFKLKYTNTNVVSNPGSLNGPRGLCLTGECKKIFTSSGDISFYPIPRNSSSDVAAAGNLGQGISVDVSPKTPDGSTINGGTLGSYYEVSIRDVSLYGITTSKSARECFRNTGNLNDVNVCNSTYDIPACKDSDQNYCLCGTSDCDTNACRADHKNFTYPQKNYNFSGDPNQSSKLCHRSGSTFMCEISLSQTVNTSDPEFQLPTSFFESSFAGDDCNPEDTTTISDRYDRIIIRARIRGKRDGNKYRWLNYSTINFELPPE